MHRLKTALVQAALLASACVLAAPAAAIPPYGDQGCWAVLFGNTGFRPPQARIDGPAFLEQPVSGPVTEPELNDVGGQAFMKRIDSLIVGPRARVRIYEQPRYSGSDITFEPGTRVKTLQAYGMGNDIGSMRVYCVDRKFGPGEVQ